MLKLCIFYQQIGKFKLDKFPYKIDIFYNLSLMQ